MSEKKRDQPEGKDRRPEPGEEGDFADEHTSMTFADDQDGGPEGIREPEAPKGRGGDGGMD